MMAKQSPSPAKTGLDLIGDLQADKRCRKLCVRVLQKWEKRMGPKMEWFKITVVDRSMAEIQIKFFRGHVAPQTFDKYYDMIEEGATYWLGNVHVQRTDPEFDQYQTDKRPNELIMGPESTLDRCDGPVHLATLPTRPTFNLTELGDLPERRDQRVDLIGKVQSVGEAGLYTTHNGDSVMRRDCLLHMADCRVGENSASVKLALWGNAGRGGSIIDEFADKAQTGDVVALKNVRVVLCSGGAGFELWSTNNTYFELNPQNRQEVPDEVKAAVLLQHNTEPFD